MLSAMPKIPSASSAFLLLGAPQTPDNTHPRKRVKTWGDGPLRLEEMVSQPTSTRSDPCPESNADDRGWEKLSSEMNILPVLIATWRVHYSPQVGYHNKVDMPLNQKNLTLLIYKTDPALRYRQLLICLKTWLTNQTYINSYIVRLFGLMVYQPFCHF